MRRKAGRVGILDKRKGILNHVRIPGSDWSNFILHCDFRFSFWVSHFSIYIQICTYVQEI